MIKENRIKRNYTQEELAEIIEISPRQLQRIERNEDKTKIETLRKIIKVLKIPDKEIIEYIKNVFESHLRYQKGCILKYNLFYF